ncbi:MAG TPA: NADH-quinone oxidoreductase subunit A [Chloroflexota bacterium]|nr:NADH-quinone oxidoreductase subunit A [Chloroflexota bacterium]
MTAEAYAATYTPVIVAAVIGVIFIASTLFVANLLAPRIRDRRKATIYECGMQPIGQGWSQMNLRYYLYAFLFLIFEIEAVFLFPWAVIFRRLGPFAFWEMMLFLAMLLFGLLYAWKKGVLQWE